MRTKSHCFAPHKTVSIIIPDIVYDQVNPISSQLKTKAVVEAQKRFARGMLFPEFLYQKYL